MSIGVDNYFKDRYPQRLEELDVEIVALALTTVDDDDVEPFRLGMIKLVDNFVQNTQLHLASFRHTLDESDMKYVERCAPRAIIDWVKERRK